MLFNQTHFTKPYFRGIEVKLVSVCIIQLEPKEYQQTLVTRLGTQLLSSIENCREYMLRVIGFI